MSLLFIWMEHHQGLTYSFITLFISFIGLIGWIINYRSSHKGAGDQAHIGDNVNGDKVLGDKNVTYNNIGTDKLVEVSPTERLKTILCDFKRWVSDGVETAYYGPSPEFVMQYKFNDKKVPNRWWRNFLDEATTTFDVDLKYNSTKLMTIPCCKFSREDLIVPYPDVDYANIDHSHQKTPHKTYSLFYFIESNITFPLLCFLMRSDGDKLLKRDAIVSQTKPPLKHLPFMIFRDEKAKNEFVCYLEENIDSFFREKGIVPTSSLGEDKLKEEESFAYWAYDLFLDKKK